MDDDLKTDMDNDESDELNEIDSANDKSTDKSPRNQENPAANLIREKLAHIYEDEPQAKAEIAEIKVDKDGLSKHQKFVLKLTKSGKTLPEIQTAWHKYYISLPDAQKNEVWQEFYEAHDRVAAQMREKQKDSDNDVKKVHKPKPEKIENIDDSPRVFEQQFSPETNDSTEDETSSIPAIKRELLKKLDKHRSSKWYQRGTSLLFGLGFGSLVIVILLFSFFNDRFIAPFITPSRNVSSDSIILDPNSVAVGPNPIIIIPKINVEIPVVYTDASIDPNVIENSLEDGVVHFPTTPYPGQLGNGVIFGHSSNNILNPGKYKFAFVLLHDLQPGDTFMLEYQSKLYVYEVYKKSIVSPNDVSVLSTQDKPATFTLITCDPPGTSINRLVVVGEQITPSPTGDTQSSVNQNTAPKPTVLPSNSISLWQRITKIF